MNTDELRKLALATPDGIFTPVPRETLLALLRCVDAAKEVLRVIDAAGLINLSNGVQLGPTVWYVKASEATDYARAALAELESAS